MKKYTQADFDNFEVDEYGRKICPANEDYLQRGKTGGREND